MSEGDRPGGEGSDQGQGRRTSRLRVYRGGARTPRPQPGSQREVARRLSALERRVERALAEASDGETIAGERLRTLLDRTLAAVASARRMTLRDLRSVAGELEQDVTEGVLEGLYRFWWRVEAVGLERVPADGPAILVTNRGGALLPYEALMVRLALAREHTARRIAHPLLEDWLAQLPFLGPALAHGGAARGGTAAVRRLLGRGEAVIVSPETTHPKPFRDRYRLGHFGRGTFARLALESQAPIVPVAVIGAEEIHPVLARLDLAGRLLGLPTLPITPTFPWFGLAGLVPLPTKWLLLAGEPLELAGRYAPGDAADPALVARLRDQVRERLQALILEGLRRRHSVFRG